jgi:S-adenosylmethionine/arginine decarboxylase-like enzyme
MAEFKPQHLHLLVHGTCFRPPLDVEALNTWFRRLVHKVGMQVVAGPTSVYVADPGNEGLTGTVTLATSHASMHVWDKHHPPMFQFDLYSCSHFERDDVIDHLAEFSLQSVDWMMIDREAGFRITDVGSR